MCDHHIRRLTPAERADRDEREAMHYETLYAEIEDAEREEHDREFRTSIPFKPDGRRVHAKVMQRIEEEKVGL